MIHDEPVLVNDREALIHQFRDVIEVRRDMTPHINRLSAESSAESRDIGDCGCVERPQGVFVECLDPFVQANFDAVGQQVILPQEVLLLHASKHRGIVVLSYGHWPYCAVPASRMLREASLTVSLVISSAFNAFP